MASILRKLIISMLIPYLWRRWRTRDERQPAYEPPAHQPGAYRQAAGPAVERP